MPDLVLSLSIGLIALLWVAWRFHHRASPPPTPPPPPPADAPTADEDEVTVDDMVLYDLTVEDDDLMLGG